MGKKHKVMGTSAICGLYGELTFEHIPPRAAFNNKPVARVLDFEQALGIGPDDVIKGNIQQKGMGNYTLCGKCNNDTGAWYGAAFVDWCYQGMDILQRAGGKPSLIYPHRIYPLRILKQILTMFFSISPESLRQNRDLVQFVLNPRQRYLPPNHRVYVYYNLHGRLRSFGTVGTLDVEPHVTRLFSEFNFPPFGYVLTLSSPPPQVLAGCAGMRGRQGRVGAAGSGDPAPGD